MSAKPAVAILAASSALVQAPLLPCAVVGSLHRFKYRLAYVERGVCVLRYDNEAGKGDHRHYDGDESAYAFTTVEALIADFQNDIRRWNDENSHP